MAFTLAEYKKQTQDPLKAGVIQTYLDNAPILNYLKFTSINGGALSYNVEGDLPTAGFRAIGAKYTADSGTIDPSTVNLTIAGGKIEIDRALRKMYGDERLATSINMKTKALARVINETFYKGDGTGGSFTGFQARIGAGQIVAQGTGALSLSNLRKAVVKCQGAVKKIFCSTDMFLLLSDAKNSADLASQITITANEFGMPVTYFSGVEVVMAGQDTAKAEILGFTEAGSTTSLYVIGFDEDGVIGVQNDGITTYMPKKEAVDTEFDIEWLMNFAIQNPDSAWRVSEVTNVAVVA